MQDDATATAPMGKDGLATGGFAPQSAALPRLGSRAPAFAARTTMGERSLEGYRGRWLVFFSHPAAFTAVCSSELVAFARARKHFSVVGCDLLALSVDSLYSHLAWVANLRERFDVEVDFPLIEDPSMAIARAYGMLDDDAASTATVRATFVIDPEGIIRAINWYPVTTGRSVDETLRLVTALQETDARGVQTPADWRPGEPGLAPTPLTTAEIDALPDNAEVVDWYYRRVTGDERPAAPTLPAGRQAD